MNCLSVFDHFVWLVLKNLSDEAVLLHTLTNVDPYHCHEILNSHMTHLGKPVWFASVNQLEKRPWHFFFRKYTVLFTVRFFIYPMQPIVCKFQKRVIKVISLLTDLINFNLKLATFSNKIKTAF